MTDKRWSEPDGGANPIEDIKAEIRRVRALTARRPPSGLLHLMFLAHGGSSEARRIVERECTVTLDRLRVACLAARNARRIEAMRGWMFSINGELWTVVAGYPVKLR